MSTETKAKLRFAPSPTGPLHIGGVRTALYNFLYARQLGGEFLLRIEDTDQNRYVPGAEAYILEALDWMGIKFDHGPHIGGPDGPYRQSERKDMYRQYAQQLVDAGKAYYAFDTPEELEAKREAAKAFKKSFLYNYKTREDAKNSLVLPADDVRERLERGDHYVIRVRIPNPHEQADVRFEDAVRKTIKVSVGEMDDKVLMKSDGMPTYHLANIVDDHLMGITHVIRGEEWLPSAPLHVLLYKYFEWEAPVFAHLPLLLSPDGNGKLSKRDGDKYGFPVFPLKWTDPESGKTSSGYREEGYLPEALRNYLALLGWNPGSDQEFFTFEELQEQFSLERVSKSGAKFDKKKCQHFNHQYLLGKSAEELLPYFKSAAESEGLTVPDDEAYLEKAVGLIKERAWGLYDLLPNGRYLLAAPESYDEKTVNKKWNETAAAFVSELAEELSAMESWTAPEIKSKATAMLEAKELGFGKVMPAVRLAVTGSGAGPDLFEIIALLGKEETLARIARATESLPVPA